MDKAMEAALATLASRAVVAEARATIAEAEIVVLKEQLIEEQSRVVSAQTNYASFAAIHWAKAGVMSNKLVEHLTNYFGDRERAEEIIKYLGSRAFQSPDRDIVPDLRWP